MRPELYTIDTPARGVLHTMARPRGGEWLAEELGTLVSAGVDVLVCLLTDAELTELGLGDEPDHAVAAGLELVRWPWEDLTVPATTPALDLARQLAARLYQGDDVVVHCRAGIGRSSVLAALVLLVLGVPVEEAWERLEEARGLPVPDTEEQRRFVGELGSRLLAEEHGRGEG